MNPSKGQTGSPLSVQDNATAECTARAASTPERVFFVGNPNVGKSLLFGVLTGRYAMVSNYPGTTVEVTRASMTLSLGGSPVEAIDTPGVDSLLPMSEDERVTRDMLLEAGPGDAILMVIDTKNLRRGLHLAVQVAEMGLPMVVVLNMVDEANDRGVFVKVEALSQILGVPVIPTVATRKSGTAAVLKALQEPRFPTLVRTISYGTVAEKAAAAIASCIPAKQTGTRALSLMLLCGDPTLREWLSENLSPADVDAIEKIRQDARSTGKPLQEIMRRTRADSINQIARKVVTHTPKQARKLVQSLGNLSMHPVYGVPILLAVLVLTYLVVGVLGAGYAVDFLQENIFEAYISPLTVALVYLVLPVGPVRDFLVGPAGVSVGEGGGLLVGQYGLVSMGLSYAIAIVLPIVGSFFALFSLMEDSGYLPRLAVVANKAFKRAGLNGKAVLPMVLGFGCVTMATITARILPTRKERILVILLLSLGIPCSAQLGVILGMLGHAPAIGIVIWIVVVALVMAVVGMAAARLLPGERSDFILEIPPLRKPSLYNVALKTLSRMEWYLKEAVPLFLLGTFVLWLLNTLGVMPGLQQIAAPLVQGVLGLPAQATDALVVGFFRRDYGAAGLYELSRQGQLDGIQIVVSLVTITLFVPCVATIFMVIKEQGVKVAMAMVAFIFPLAFAVGGLVNLFLRSIW